MGNGSSSYDFSNTNYSELKKNHCWTETYPWPMRYGWSAIASKLSSQLAAAYLACEFSWKSCVWVNTNMYYTLNKAGIWLERTWWKTRHTPSRLDRRRHQNTPLFPSTLPWTLSSSKHTCIDKNEGINQRLYECRGRRTETRLEST